jgi:Fe-S cluster assembly iron-binding protein IscA
LTLEEPKERDIQWQMDNLAVYIDAYAKIFIYKELEIDFAEDRGFIIRDTGVSN